MDPEFICHHLNVNPVAIPRRQQPQWSSKEHAEAVKEEFNKLKQAEAIYEHNARLAFLGSMPRSSGLGRRKQGVTT